MVKLVGVLLIPFLAACATTGSLNENGFADAMEQSKAYYERALYSEAERILLELDKDRPENYDVNFLLGNIYVRTGQFPAAEERYRECVIIDSSQPKGWYNLSLLKIKEAIALAEEGKRKTRLTDASFTREFNILTDGLVRSITGK